MRLQPLAAFADNYIWTLTDDTIESTAATRGGYARWVRAVRDRIARFGRVALSGRTFQLTPGG